MHVRISQSVPRHLCRRAIRNTQIMLYESSRRMYEVSRNTDLVSRYRIELPAGWRNTECTMNLDVAEGQISRQEDLLVGGQNPLLGAQPYAEQFAGCGVRGLQVEEKDKLA